MVITFDPKANRVENGGETTKSATTQTNSSAGGVDSFTDEALKQEGMNLLFSGVRHHKELQKMAGSYEIDVPHLEKDLLKPSPILGQSSRTMEELIRKYKMLRKNLIERHQNFSAALKGSMRMSEREEIALRLKAIDDALIKVEQNLQRALEKKSDQQKREADQAARARQARLEEID